MCIICIPCMYLATQLNLEEEDIIEAVVDNDDDVESCTSSIVSISSDEDNNDSKSNGPNSSSGYENYYELQNNKIPNVSKWTDDQMFEYLTEVLPQTVVNQLIEFNLDGPALQSLKRTDIVLNMGLKLGPALSFYKEVRILQTRSTCCLNYYT